MKSPLFRVRMLTGGGDLILLLRVSGLAGGISLEAKLGVILAATEYRIVMSFSICAFIVLDLWRTWDLRRPLRADEDVLKFLALPPEAEALGGEGMTSGSDVIADASGLADEDGREVVIDFQIGTGLRAIGSVAEVAGMTDCKAALVAIH